MHKSDRNILLSMVLGLVTFSQHIQASEGIESMRLFYTAEERVEEERDYDEGETINAKESANLTDVKTLKVAEEVESAVVIGRASAAKSLLVFNAIVSLNNRYVAIINDLPCPIESPNTSRTQLFVVCTQSDLSKFKLAVSADATQLNVYHGARKLASLAVGEQL